LQIDSNKAGGLMALGSFERLSTVPFQRKMKPAAIKIYQSLFPGCKLVDLRGQGCKVHVLDKEFGIDVLLHMEAGNWISIQEKYRENYYLRYGDFTQEHMNAYGTKHESEGEWFKLGAQLYFYGWANQQETGFEKWVLLDIVKYKMLVAEHGGLAKIGTWRQNNIHGKASFYGIKLDKLQPCIIAQNTTTPILNPRPQYPQKLKPKSHLVNVSKFDNQRIPDECPF